jgi:membrane fusion protein (multidrug efflux system)
MTASSRLIQLIALCIPITALAQNPPPVAVTEAQPEAIIEEIRVTGSVISLSNALLSATVAGRVDSIEADIGTRVEQGTPLLRLDPELEQAALEAARAARAEAEAALADARRRLSDAERLGANRGISESEIKSLQAEVRMDEAALARLRAEERRQQTRVERHVVRAPFSGVVSQRLVDPGEWLTPGDGVMGLVATDALRADFPVAQQHFSRVTEQTGVSIRLDALPERRFQGRITAIVPVSDPAARTFMVRTRFDNPDNAPVTAGMSAQSTLSVDTGRKAQTLPRDALLRHPDGRITVWVVNDTDPATVTERQVEIGLTFAGRVEIRQGLNPGDKVVTRGNEGLREGQSVRIQDRAGG